MEMCDANLHPYLQFHTDFVGRVDLPDASSDDAVGQIATQGGN